MLVLSRRIGESIKVGDDIEIIVLGVDRGQVRLGFEAPKTTNIVRTELLNRFDESEADEFSGEEAQPPFTRRPQVIRTLRRRY